MTTDLVLRSQNIWRTILPYQPGLTQPLLNILTLTTTIHAVQSGVNQWTATYLISNLPPRFATLPFIQHSINSDKKIPHYALCLPNSNFADIAIVLPLALTIIEGQEHFVRQWMQCKPSWRDSNALELATACGHLHIVSTLYKYGVKTTERAMDFAAMNGDLDILKWFHDRGQHCTTRAMDGAASYGHIEVVKFLQHHRSEGASAIALTRAASNGHADIVKFLLDHGYDEFDHELYTSSDPLYQGSYRVHTRKVVGNEHLEAFQLLVDHGISGFGTAVFDQLIEKCGLNAVKYLHKHQLYKVSGASLERAVLQRDAVRVHYIANKIHQDNEADSTKTQYFLPPRPWHHSPKFYQDHELQMLERLGIVDNVQNQPCQAMDYAAYLGDIDTVILLHRLRIQCCTQQAINFACGSGHLDIAQWLYANRTEGMNTLALTYAVATHQYDVVLWLRQLLLLRCSTEALITAISHRDGAMLDLVMDFPFDSMAVWDRRGSPFYKSISKEDPFLVVDANGENALLDRVLYYNYDDITRKAALHGRLDLLQYLLIQRNYVCDPKVFQAAVEGGHLETLKYLMKVCSSYAPDAQVLYQTAVSFSRISTLKWLADNFDADISTNQCEGGMQQELSK